jgi:hypothetical protein
MKNKKVMKTGLIVFLVVLMLGLTATSFAYWDQLTQTKEDPIVNIGEGKKVVVSETVNNTTEKLIPVGAIEGIDEVYAIELNYTVNLDKEAATALTLTVEASEVKIGGETTFADKVIITITPSTTTLNNIPTTVKVTVTLDPTMVTDTVDYSSIFNGVISFKLTFSAAQ